MSRVSRRMVRFVHALIGVSAGVADGGIFRAGVATLEAGDVERLAQAGILTHDRNICRPSPLARGWLRRRLLESADPFAAQHRREVRARDGKLINLDESPLSRLAVPAAGESVAFLEPHQVEAGERVRKLCDRARLQPRVTMSYSGAHTARGKGPSTAAEISDLAAEARKSLAELHQVLPADCAGVVLDVCGLLKGLQVVETERGWPRRSAKLVLRIGLDQLARHYGLGPNAVGTESTRPRRWLDTGARPDRFE